MKTFAIENRSTVLYLSLTCLALSGCDLRGWNTLGNSAESTTRSSHVALAATAPETTAPVPTVPERNWGHSGDWDFGGKPSKKQSQQKSSGEDDDHWPHHPQSPQLPQSPHNPQSPHDPQSPQQPQQPQSSYLNVAREGAVQGAGQGARTTHDERRAVGESCRSNDRNQICLGLKYVSYVDGRGGDVESELDAVRDVAYVNKIWGNCGIQFQLDDYQRVRPQEYELRYRTRNYDELNQIRGTFAEPGVLLVVATGLWDRSGSLGNSWANAWTNLPGERLTGVVLEHSVSGYPQILAHELGHYLSLDHTQEAHTLMHPVVHRQSIDLSREECKAARWAARTYWRDMMR